MNKRQYRCKMCQAPIAGKADCCVRCYSIAHVPCPQCSWLDLRGKRHTQTKCGTRLPIDCGTCNNERWILDLDRLRRYVQGKPPVDKPLPP
jgi:hypothetical protein